MEKLPGTIAYTADAAPLYDPALYSSVYLSCRKERREKTDRLKFLPDRCLSLGAEYLLIHALNEAGLDYGKLRFPDSGLHKPYIEGDPFYFNLSHSGTKVMCVLSPFQAGCDVQKLPETSADSAVMMLKNDAPAKMPGSPSCGAPSAKTAAERAEGAGYSPDGKNKAVALLRLAGRFFTEEEYESLASLSEGPAVIRRFYRLWTLKESFIKCTGLGLALPMNSFSVSLCEEGASVTRTDEAASYRFFEKDFSDGYAYAVCLKETPETDIRWETVSIR